MNKSEHHLSAGGKSEISHTARTAGDTGKSRNFHNHVLIRNNSGRGHQFALTRGDTGGVIYSSKVPGHEESNELRLSKDVGDASIQFCRNSKNGGPDIIQASFGEQSD